MTILKYDHNNIFAQIIAAKLPSNKVYEDDKILAIHDINPVAKVHVLVMPKAPYINYDDFVKNATAEELSYYFTKIHEIAHSLELISGSYRVITNVGLESGQSVFHFHTHIIGGERIDSLI